MQLNNLKYLNKNAVLCYNKKTMKRLGGLEVLMMVFKTLRKNVVRSKPLIETYTKIFFIIAFNIGKNLQKGTFNSRSTIEHNL